MKNKFLLLIPILLLTGCTINYNLEIDSSSITETITGTVTKEEIELKDKSTGVNIYRNYLYNDQKVFKDKDNLYKRSITEEDDIVKYNYSYTYRNNYKNSRIIDTCFDNSVVEETDEFYYISLTGNFNCLYSDKVTINVTSDYAVLENNADKVNDNTYTWVINKEDDVDISITVSKELKYEQETKRKTISTFQIVGLVVLIILSLITYILYKKKNSEEL